MTKKTILLVDDNLYVLEILEISLSLRYNTLRATNGWEALEVLNKEDVDLILLDLNMPLMSGLEFFKHIRKQESWKDLPVIFFSGALGKEGLSENLLQHITEADGFIEKPIIPTKIIQKIESVLSKK